MGNLVPLGKAKGEFAAEIRREAANRSGGRRLAEPLKAMPPTSKGRGAGVLPSYHSHSRVQKILYLADGAPAGEPF